MDKFEEKETMKKETLEKNTCYNCLFNYNPESSISPPPKKIKKWAVWKEKSFFKTKINKYYVKPVRAIETVCIDVERNQEKQK